MLLSPITARLLIANAFAIEEKPLRAGTEVVARVLAAPPGGGAGLLSLAGSPVHARVPPGLLEGQKITLTVVGVNEAGELVVRLRPGREGANADERATARLAGALAASGDGELLRAALGLTDGAAGIVLPNGAAAGLRVEADSEQGEESERGRGSEAEIVLHAPELGPIELGLRLDAGGLRVSVRMEPGKAVERAEAARRELVVALERATDGPVLVEIAARSPVEQRPGRLPVQEGFDALA